MTKSKIFLIFSISFIVGVYLGQYFQHWQLALLFLLTLFVLIVIEKYRVIIFVSTAILILACLWFQARLIPSKLTKIYEQKVELKGIVDDEPDVRIDKTFLTLKVNEGKILATVPNYPEYKFGEELLVLGKVVEPKDLNDFSYKRYLKRFGIDALMYYPKTERTNNFRGNKIKAAILELKNKFENKIKSIIPEPESSFLNGILLGSKGSMPQEVLDQFNRTGTTHLVAISGFNITLVANGLSSLFNKFGRRIAFIFSLLGIIGFVILTGASASVVRAGLMGALLLLAKNIGRLYVVTNAMCLTAIIMLVQNPLILSYDFGFQLSFLALIGIVYLVPIFQKLLKAPNFIQEYFFTSIAAQIFTVPLILYNFGEISFISPLVNLFVLPLIPIAMLLGFVAAVLSFVSEFAAQPITWVSWQVMHIILRIIEQGSEIKFASATVEKFPLSIILGYYLVVILFVIYFRSKWKRKPKIY